MLPTKARSHGVGAFGETWHNSASLRRRFVGHSIFWFLFWPAFSVLMAALSFREQSVTAGVPFGFALAGTAGGALHLIPEITACSLLLTVISVSVFWLTDRGSRLKLISYWVECTSMFVALWLGAAFEFPALLHHPFLQFLRSQPVWWAYVTIGAVLLTIAVVAASAKKRGAAFATHFGIVLSFVILGWAWTFVPVRGLGHVAGANRVVLLGLDSISQADDLSALRHLTSENHGTFYERAVTPGLMTNSVWQALVMHRMPSATGVLLIYQDADWTRSPFHLVREARRRGYDTWSFFGDQFTCYTGSASSFDHDESGPIGWLQEATSQVKEGSVLIPLLLSRLPRVPFARTPRNQAGTYAHDLRVEIEDMLTAGGNGPTFVAGHIDYLHLPSYPRMSELSPAERRAVRHARVSSIRDLSLDWQFPVVDGDPIGLYQWKFQHLQRMLTEVIDRTQFLDQSRHNRLILFSDHGNRKGLLRTGFGQPQYYNVLLSTFGTPSGDPARPISLLDIPTLLGFQDATSPEAADPAVEYVNLEGDREWENAMRGARLQMDGRIVFRPEVTGYARSLLKGFRPYSDTPTYYEPTVVQRSHSGSLRADARK